MGRGERGEGITRGEHHVWKMANLLRGGVEGVEVITWGPTLHLEDSVWGGYSGGGGGEGCGEGRGGWSGDISGVEGRG